MTEARPAIRAKLFCGILAISEKLIEEITEELVDKIGTVDSVSHIMPFGFTDYYGAEMGDELQRRFVSFEELIDPAQLIDTKLLTNGIEAARSVKRNGIACRTVNLDPGYINASRLVLATCKDFSHRLYLGKGVYGEITLNFDRKGIIEHPWTYPDFRTKAYQDFFLNLRSDYVRELRAED